MKCVKKERKGVSKRDTSFFSRSVCYLDADPVLNMDVAEGAKSFYFLRQMQRKGRKREGKEERVGEDTD